MPDAAEYKRMMAARDIMRPETFKSVPVGTHTVARAVARFGMLLTRYGHEWNKKDKHLYQAAIRSVRHPTCPGCAAPMAESTVTLADGIARKIWYCATCPNL